LVGGFKTWEVWGFQNGVGDFQNGVGNFQNGVGNFQNGVGDFHNGVGDLTPGKWQVFLRFVFLDGWVGDT